MEWGKESQRQRAVSSVNGGPGGGEDERFSALGNCTMILEDTAARPRDRGTSSKSPFGRDDDVDFGRDDADEGDAGRGGDFDAFAQAARGGFDARQIHQRPDVPRQERLQHIGFAANGDGDFAGVNFEAAHVGGGGQHLHFDVDVGLFLGPVLGQGRARRGRFVINRGRYDEPRQNRQAEGKQFKPRII